MQSPSEPRVRARILEAASKRFQSFGYRRTGVAEIARDAGISAGTIYRYFPSKEDIFRAVMRTFLERWLDRVRRALDEPGTPLERLMRLGPASVEHAKENSLLVSLLTRDTEIIFPPLLEELRDEVYERTVALMADVVRDGIREGFFREVDPERFCFVIITMGSALYHQTQRPYEEVLPVYVDVLLHGILAR